MNGLGAPDASLHTPSPNTTGGNNAITSRVRPLWGQEPPPGLSQPMPHPPQAKAKYSALSPQPPALWNLLSHSWDGRLPTNEGQECGHWSFQESRRKKAPQPSLSSSSQNNTGDKRADAKHRTHCRRSINAAAANWRSLTCTGHQPQWPLHKSLRKGGQTNQGTEEL